MTQRKPTLLIVDDEAVTRDLLSQVFAKRGHKVSSAKDGFTALQKIRAEPPDIVLSDLNMPGMSGFELLSVLRRRIPGIYVIATSGAYSGNAVPEGVAADAFYEKASNLQELFQPVVVDPVAGAFELDHAGVPEFAEAAVLLGVGGPAFLAVHEQDRAGDVGPERAHLFGREVGRGRGADVVVELPGNGAVGVPIGAVQRKVSGHFVR